MHYYLREHLWPHSAAAYLSRYFFILTEVVGVSSRKRQICRSSQQHTSKAWHWDSLLLWRRHTYDINTNRVDVTTRARMNSNFSSSSCEIFGLRLSVNWRNLNQINVGINSHFEKYPKFKKMRSSERSTQRIAANTNHRKSTKISISPAQQNRRRLR